MTEPRLNDLRVGDLLTNGHFVVRVWSVDGGMVRVTNGSRTEIWHDVPRGVVFAASHLAALDAAVSGAETARDPECARSEANKMRALIRRRGWISEAV